MIWLIKKLLLILKKWKAVKEFLLRYEKDYTERYCLANSQTFKDRCEGALTAISNIIRFMEKMEDEQRNN